MTSVPSPRRRAQAQFYATHFFCGGRAGWCAELADRKTQGEAAVADRISRHRQRISSCILSGAHAEGRDHPERLARRSRDFEFLAAADRADLHYDECGLVRRE